MNKKKKSVVSMTNSKITVQMLPAAANHAITQNGF